MKQINKQIDNMRQSESSKQQTTANPQLRQQVTEGFREKQSTWTSVVLPSEGANFQDRKQLFQE